jgi:hypothetical protein
VERLNGTGGSWVACKSLAPSLPVRDLSGSIRSAYDAVSFLVLRLLSAGAFAGWDLYPLESAAFPRSHTQTGHQRFSRSTRCPSAKRWKKSSRKERWQMHQDSIMQFDDRPTGAEA